MGFPISGACGVAPGEVIQHGTGTNTGFTRIFLVGLRAQALEHQYVRCGPAQSHCTDAAQHQHLVKKLATKKRRSTGHNKIQHGNILLSHPIFAYV
jgi:hypothetical protein